MNPLYSVFSLLALCLILLLMTGWLVLHLIRLSQSNSLRLVKENQELRNRLMTHSWMEFGNLQQIQSPVSNLSSEDEVRGMSDEEELKRIGKFFGEGDGLGEVLVEQRTDDFDSIEQWKLRT